MKNLRQLIRRSGLLSNGKRRRRNEKSRSGVTSRPLTTETLEKRQLLAGDVLSPQHNYWNSYDVNDDGQITSRDALAIINVLGRESFEAEAGAATDADAPPMFYDVNADNTVSASDALGVINALSRGEEVGELIELQLRALTDPDDINSEITSGTVTKGETFYLEVSYDDLRLFNDRLGAFQLFTDIAVSQPGVLVPVLNETQQIIIGGAFTQSPFPTSITFGIEGSAQTVDSTFNDFANNSVGEIERVLGEFGYASSDVKVTSLSLEGNDLGFQIAYLGTDNGNVDIPDLTIEVNENGGAEVPTQFIEFAPFEADGVTPNSAAVRFNINTFSRTFNDNEPFYSNQNRGDFDGTAGFTGVGGLGKIPSQGGGIPQLTDNGEFIEPFDAFSIPVQIIGDVTNLQISVNPGEGNEATLLYGRDDALPQDLVLLDDDAVVTLSTVPDTGLAPSFSATPTALAGTEDNVVTIDLSTLVVEGSPTSFAIVTDGTRGSSSITGSVLTFTPNQDENGSDTIVYSGTDDQNRTGQGTIGLTLAPVNDAPVAGTDSFNTPADTALSISTNELIANDTTGAANEADTLTVTAVGAATQAGSTVVLSGGTVTYTPATGITSDSFTYTLSDGTDTATGTVNITIGSTGVPTLSNAGSATIDEDGTLTFDLSSLVVSGTVDSFNVSDGSIGASTVSGNILTYVPDPDENGSDTVTVTATNAGGTSNEATLTITINPINDQPNAGDDQAAVTVGQSVTINVLENDDEGADNEDNDVLTIDSVSGVDAGATAVINGGTTVTYTPAAGLTGTSTDQFSYVISDGNGGTATATVTVTITGSGSTSAPVVTNGTLQVQENTNGTVDLSTLVTGDGTITFAVTSPTANGSATLSGSVVTYTPNANFDGSDTISFTATNTGGTSTGSIAVTVTPVGAGNTLPTANNITVAATEDTPTSFDVLALSNASANDAGQTLSITSVGSANNGGTVSVNAAGGIDYAPAADFFGTETFAVTIADSGASPNTVDITVTVNVAAVNDAPTVTAGQSATATGTSPVTINVLNGATSGAANENDNVVLSDASVPTNQGSVTFTPAGEVTFTPAAAFTGQATISFTASDGQATTDGSVAVTVQAANAVSISGSVFIDQIDNLERVIFGEVPSRNGIRDAGEHGVGGITVHLMSSTGATIATVVTDASGNYSFTGVPEGTHTIHFALPNTISAIGSTSASVTVTDSGVNRQPSLALSGTNNSGLETISILSSSYLRTNTAMASASNGGRQGGLVSMNTDGSQSFIIMNEGFDGTRFAQLILNDTHDAAILVIARDGATSTEVAALGKGQFVVTANGRGVQFYGGLEDFSFQPTAGDAIRAEFAGYQDAVDAALAQLGV